MLVESAGEVPRPKPALRLAAVFVVGTVAACLLLEAGWPLVGDQRPQWQREVTYTVFVRGPAGSNFTVLVPALVDPVGTPADVLRRDPILTGAIASVEIVETEHGHAFSISGTGEVNFWVRGGPPSSATEPTTHRVRFPGGNWDLGMAAPDPPGWTPGGEGSFGVPIGHAWVNFESSAPPAQYRVVVTVNYPTGCADHTIVHDWNGTAGWDIVGLEARVGCPVP